MPVVKQKGEDSVVTQDELLECTLQRTLDICGKHHEGCSKRRRNGVSYEIRVERQRSEWLTRKYVDNLRQQQALSGRLEVPARPHLSSSSDSADNMDTTNIKQSPSLPDTPEKLQAPQRDMPDGSNPSQSSDTKAQIPQDGHCSNGHQNHSETFSNVVIKTEPTSVENAPTCTKSPPRPMASSRLRNKTPPGSISLGSGCTNGIGTPEPKRRRMSLRSPPKGAASLRGRSFSSPEDLEDDLTLSAEEFITGVNSNPPIKPLEEGDEPPITPSPPTSASLAKADPPKTSTSAITPESSSGPDSSMRQDLALRQDLDEFSKVMYKVTHEQIARERHNTYSMLPNRLYTTAQSSDMAASHTYTQAQVQARTPIISPPPYYAAGNEPMATVSSGRYFSPSTQLTPLQRHLSIPPSPSYLSSPHLTQHHPHLHTQVDHSYPQPPPINLQLRPPLHIQKPHPRHLPLHSAISQHPSQPPLMSPTIHTPISTRMPTFADHNLPTVTAPPHPPHTPNNLPQTPTTPLEHFNTFSSRPSSQISPTHTHFHTPPISLPNIFPTTNPNPQLSPTVTIADNSWDRHPHITHAHSQGSTLRDALLTQVNTHLEALTGQNHSMGLSFAPRISQSATVVRTGIPMPGMQLPSQYPVSFTGLSSSLPHTISYSSQHSNSAFHHPM